MPKCDYILSTFLLPRHPLIIVAVGVTRTWLTPRDTVAAQSGRSLSPARVLSIAPCTQAIDRFLRLRLHAHWPIKTSERSLRLSGGRRIIGSQACGTPENEHHLGKSSIRLYFSDTLCHLINPALAIVPFWLGGGGGVVNWLEVACWGK